MFSDGEEVTPLVRWLTADAAPHVAMACPNCGAAGDKPVRMVLDGRISPRLGRPANILACPSCTCLFYEVQVLPDYADAGMTRDGRLALYIQQGAGVSVITQPLARLRAQPGSRYLEVGCGFGFGVDYAGHAKRWLAEGIDPAANTAEGARRLGATMHVRYLGADEPAYRGACAVVMASETIEHLPSPLDFVRILRGVLAPGGTLVLTTPDAEAITPDSPPGALLPMLSPGLHLVLQSARSLEQVLRAAGFSHVEIGRVGHALIAYASDLPLDLERDQATVRREYRGWLRARAGAFAGDKDLYFGFAGRAFLEAVNDADFAEAAALEGELGQACHRFFARSLDEAASFALAVPAPTLALLADNGPLGLGAILYGRAIARLGRGAPRGEMEAAFLQAASVADVLRRAARGVNLDDALAEDIAWSAKAEALLCAAAIGDATIVQLLAECLARPAPSEARRQELPLRVLVELVNAGHAALGKSLDASLALSEAPWARAGTSLSSTERDALFCLGVIDAQSRVPDDLARGRERFARVCAVLEAQAPSARPPGLLDAARQGEKIAADLLAAHGDASTPGG